MTRKFKHWAYLNDKGKAEFGDVFPDGVVPVLSMVPMFGSLGSPDNPPENYFMIYLPEVTADQLDQIYTKLADRFKVRVAKIDAQVREIGLPLRQSLTSGSGTDHAGLFV